MSTFPEMNWPKGKIPEANAMVDEAVRLLNSGLGANYTAAMDLLNKAVKIDPAHPFAWWRMGSLLIRPPQYQDGLELMRHQIDVAPSPEAYKHAAYILHLGGLNEQALPIWREGVAKYPDDRELPALLGETLLSLTDYDEAAAVLAAEVEKHPKSSRLHLNLARALAAPGHLDDAASHYREAARYEPGADMWIAVANGLAGLGRDLDAADELAHRAVEQAEAQTTGWTLPDAASFAQRPVMNRLIGAWQVTGWIAYKRGDFDRAKRYLVPAMELAFSPDAAFRLAQVEEGRQDLDAAATAYALAIAWSRTPLVDASARFVALVPDEAARQAAMQRAAAYRRDLVPHTLHRPSGAAEARAGFIAVVDASGVVRDVAVDGVDVVRAGDAASVVEALRGVFLGPRVPWNDAVRTLRRGSIVCAAGQPECTLTMFTPQPPMLGN